MATIKMVELYGECSTLVDEWNGLNMKSEPTPEDLKRMKEIEVDIPEKVKDYAKLAKAEALGRLVKEDDPLMALIKELQYEVIKVKDEQDDAGNTSKQVQYALKTYDPADLVKYVKDRKGTCAKVGHDPKFLAMIERFNVAMTARTAGDLGLDPKSVNDSIAMSEIAKEIDLGNNPCSNTQLLKTLTKVIQAMIGEEYKPVSHDVKFLLNTFSKKGRKALTVTASNLKTTRGIITEICHRLVTDKSYDLDYKTK